MTILKENDEIPVGKYEGYLVKEIVDIDPSYLLNFNYSDYSISEEITKAIILPIKKKPYEWDYPSNFS